MFPFDLDFSKILVFGIIAIAVIPPKDLPRVMRTVGQTITKMRRMARDFQNQFMDAIKEADLESVKNEFASLEKAAKLDTNFDPVADIKKELEPALQEPARSADALVPPPASAPEIAAPASVVAAPEQSAQMAPLAVAPVGTVEEPAK